MIPFSSALAKDEKIEIKYLLVNERLGEIRKFEEDQNLQAADAEAMKIYFFETPNQGLGGQGLILRLRQRSVGWEFTVKERPVNGTLADPTIGKSVKEKTVKKSDAVESFSVNIPFNGAQAAKAIANNNLESLLDAAKSELSKFNVDWSTVRAFGPIDAKRWTISSLNGLDAEEWDYVGQVILELSLEGKAGKADQLEASLIDYLSHHNLDPDKSGGMKTKAALDALSGK